MPNFLVLGKVGLLTTRGGKKVIIAWKEVGVSWTLGSVMGILNKTWQLLGG